MNCWPATMSDRVPSRSSKPRSPIASWLCGAATQAEPRRTATASLYSRRMTNAPKRTMADLSAYPDLVVIFLGMRVEEPRGLATLQKLGPEIQASVEEQPDGLLLHERLTFSTEPLHTGMRQYWRDFEALEAWSLELPHKAWWTDYLRDRGGT